MTLVVSIFQQISTGAVTCAALIGLAFSTAQAADSQNSPSSWQGLWIALGTPFALQLVQTAPGAEVKLQQVESMGFEWTATSVREQGDALLIDVDYAGVTGTVRVIRQSASTALASPLSCTPEYMVVCVLSKGQSAVFKLITSSPADP